MSNTANFIKEFEALPIDTKAILYEFSKHLFQNVFFKNKVYLIENSKEIIFDQSSWKHNPQAFCLEEYDMPQIYPLIFLTNNIRSNFEFTREKMNSKIIAPTKTAIANILIFPRI